MGPVRITTESFTDGTVVATVTSRRTGKRFKVKGALESAVGSQDRFSNRYEVRFNGIRDTCELVIPDVYYVRIIPPN